MWLTFAPIPNYTAALYGITASQVNWFSISFFVVTLLVGFVAIAILDIFGLRVSVSAHAVRVSNYPLPHPFSSIWVQGSTCLVRFFAG